MKESPKYTERRQHIRASVKNIVLGVLNIGEPEIIGSITDISFGGVKFTYNELRMIPQTHSIHSIDLIADSNCLLDIPCDYVWNKTVETESDSKSTNLRQYGIQFDKLTPWQYSLLKSIIDDFDSLGLNGIKQ